MPESAWLTAQADQLEAARVRCIEVAEQFLDWWDGPQDDDEGVMRATALALKELHEAVNQFDDMLRKTYTEAERRGELRKE